jgi:hypothetical protein
MDEFDFKTDTGKIATSFYFCQLSCDKEVVKMLLFCETQDA